MGHAWSEERNLSHNKIKTTSQPSNLRRAAERRSVPEDDSGHQLHAHHPRPRRQELFLSKYIHGWCLHPSFPYIFSTRDLESVRRVVFMSPLGDRCLLAVPKKGRMAEKCVRLLEDIGLEFRRNPRLDIAHCTNIAITLVFLNCSDIPKFVGMGAVDVGIGSRDYVQEGGVEVKELIPLGFGKCGLQVQAPVDEYKSVTELVGKRVVTSFPHLASQYFDKLAVELGMPKGCTTVIEVSGSVEASISLGLGDGVVDLVETGETMRAAGLEALETVMETEALLIANKHPRHPDLVHKLAQRIKGRLVAKKFVMVAYNVAESKLDEAAKITPGMKSPTITKLAQTGWMAVSAMVEKKGVQEVMDRLQSIGAKDILVTEFSQCRVE